jgi:hypothetical protein
LKKIGESFLQSHSPSSISQHDIKNNRSEPSSWHQSKVAKAFVLFLAGSGAGMASTAATYPFDIMRTQFTIQGKDQVFQSMQSFISHTFKTKGISGIYKHHHSINLSCILLSLSFVYLYLQIRILCRPGSCSCRNYPIHGSELRHL